MNKLSLRSFCLVLFIFAISVIMTMYSMDSENEERMLFGINYGYFLVPLFVVNLFILFINIKSFDVSGFNVYIVLWVIMVSLNVMYGGKNTIVNLVRVNLWTTTFLSAFFLAKSESNTFDSISKLFVIIYFVSLFFFLQGKIVQQNELKRGVEESSNAIYCLITLVPFLLFLNNKRLSFVLLLITFVCTIFSNKRGATIIMALIFIPAVESMISKMKNKGLRLLLFFLIGAVIAISFVYIGNSYVGGRLLERFDEMGETGGSGRLELWYIILDKYQDSSLLEQLLGHGHRSVAGIGWASAAHNDFLEVLYDYGFLGLIIYIGFHISLIRKAFFLRKTRNHTFYPFVSMYLIFVTMSMVSILIVQQRYLIYLAVFWGMLEGCNYNYQQIQSESKYYEYVR